MCRSLSNGSGATMSNRTTAQYLLGLFFGVVVGGHARVVEVLNPLVGCSTALMISISTGLDAPGHPTQSRSRKKTR